MTSDLQSLLAAIVADPADDTARLVYADCLQEHGNSARAEFIRLQVEAERHHPDSNTRGALEAQARALFEQNWAEWWGEVCEAVGTPADEFRGYHVTGYGTLSLPHPARVWPLLPEHYPVVFRRGFPESVAVPALAAVPGSDPAGLFLARWATVSPLTELIAVSNLGYQRYAWPEGPYLNTVRRLTLNYRDRDTLRDVLNSPNLSAADHFTMVASYGSGANEELFPDDLGATLASAHAPRLKHLSISHSSARIVELLADAESLTGLESLRLPVPWYSDYPGTFATVSLDALAGGPNLRALRKLSLTVSGSPDEAARLLQLPTWDRLTHLELDFGRGQDELGIFRRQDALVNLEEFRLGGTVLTAEAVRDLARSPLLKRVKHFALHGVYNDGRALLPLVDAVDPARIETFAIGVPYFPERAANALREKFGDKFRLLPT